MAEGVAEGVSGVAAAIEAKVAAAGNAGRLFRQSGELIDRAYKRSFQSLLYCVGACCISDFPLDHRLASITRTLENKQHFMCP
jgi:hypothetical protein